MTHERSDLRFHRDFRRLWTADTVSQIGAGVTLVALPLVAIRTLHASPFEASLLVMFEYLAALVIGLPVGAWVDRMRQRRVMMAGDVCRAVLLGSIPLTAAMGALTLSQLYAVAFGVSVCTAFFDVSFQSYLPRLVAADQLVQGNVKLETTRNVAQAGGPGFGGAIVGALTAPTAIVVNVVTFVLSALSLARIRTPDVKPPASGGNLKSEIAEGLRLVFGDRSLRAITLSSAISNMCATIGASMLLVLLAGRLHLSSFLCGLVFTAEAVGGLLGALAVGRVVSRLGQGPAMWMALIVSSVLWLLTLPMYQADWRFALALLLNSLGWVSFMTYKISSVSMRQRLCPKPLLGRMTATFRFVVWGLMPVGALMGGILGQTLGPRQAMWIGVLGELAASLPILLSPLRTMHDLPPTLDEAPEQADDMAAAT
ncbi:MFS transporter [Streptomyces tropicalis]|uniref:MFS transporter n=1 Tax=Streptomyces tropicalis TaxID=3034234 RepID=A0ABT6A487_9ACTN|nr:MFS transporter [Streptomyces tropicalis]MDF3299449.1 MFS transporter [Streptomyces tropicalis]